MPTSQDLMGYGTPSHQATLLGDDTVVVTATGTTQATAAPLRGDDGGIFEITAASVQTGVILPSTALLNCQFFLASVGGTAAKFYAPVGHTLNGVASSTGLVFQAATGAVIVQQTRPKVWWTIGTTTVA